MRCYFLIKGRIVDAESLKGLSDEAAVVEAHVLYQGRRHQFDGFEVWQGTRMVKRYPDPFAAERQPGTKSNDDGAFW